MLLRNLTVKKRPRCSASLVSLQGDLASMTGINGRLNLLVGLKEEKISLNFSSHCSNHGAPANVRLSAAQPPWHKQGWGLDKPCPSRGPDEDLNLCQAHPGSSQIAGTTLSSKHDYSGLL